MIDPVELGELLPLIPGFDIPPEVVEAFVMSGLSPDDLKTAAALFTARQNEDDETISPPLIVNITTLFGEQPNTALLAGRIAERLVASGEQRGDMLSVEAVNIIEDLIDALSRRGLYNIDSPAGPIINASNFDVDAFAAYMGMDASLGVLRALSKMCQRFEDMSDHRLGDLLLELGLVDTSVLSHEDLINAQLNRDSSALMALLIPPPLTIEDDDLDDRDEIPLPKGEVEPQTIADVIPTLRKLRIMKVPIEKLFAYFYINSSRADAYEVLNDELLRYVEDGSVRQIELRRCLKEFSQS